MPKDDSIAIFVHERNIARYRRLLQVPLDVQRRQAILPLLAQEEIAGQEPIRASGEVLAPSRDQGRGIYAEKNDSANHLGHSSAS